MIVKGNDHKHKSMVVSLQKVTFPVNALIPDVEAIFIDLGNTLRILTKNEEHQTKAREKIAELVHSAESPTKLCEVLDQRYKTYRNWAFETMVEAPEYELWTRWLLPDYPAEAIAEQATELTYLYRQTMGKRILQADAKSVISQLDKRGYRLGIISNLISTREIPEWLEADGLTHYFKAVVLSSVFGRRKPDPEIYREASRRIGIHPGKCAYVGDNFRRDIEGTRRAGFGMVIILIDRNERTKLPQNVEQSPDVIIDEFRQLLELFPTR